MAERQDSDREVLTSLPRSRPVRRSAKRGDRTEAKTGAASAQSRRATATKPRAPKAASSSATKRKPSTKTTSKSAPRRKIPPAGYAPPTARADDTRTSGGADLVSTTIQAAAELAQIGLTVGRQTLQSMLDRLPKP